ncbi:MAG: LPP20 family lipoprotein [candidate division WOR-3 bacterium]
MKRLLITAVALAVPLAGQQTKTGTRPAGDKSPFTVAEPDTQKAYIQPVENGVINWTQGYIRARGYAVVSEKEANKPKARLGAERAATVIAQRNLLEIAKGVYINSETVVEDMMLSSDVIVSRVEGVVKGAKMVGQPHWLPDGVVMVEMEMPLYGQNSLLSAVAPNNPTTKPDSQALKAIGDAPCIVIDGKGQVQPGLMPRFFDEKGNLVLDFSQIIDPKNPQGIKYVNNLSDILQCGDQAWVIEALGAVGKGKTDMIVSEKSKDKLSWLKKTGKFLWEAGKVVMMLF